MARSNTLDNGTPSPDNRDASAADQQELYGRLAPTDLDEGRVGRDDEAGADNANPGRGTDASGQPSTARSGANTQ